MKRYDLENKELAFLYQGEGSPDIPKMPDEDIKKGLEIVAQLTNGPLKFMNATMSAITQREIQGIYIPMDKEGKILGVTMTADTIAPAIKALEQALMRLKEAQKKEMS